MAKKIGSLEEESATAKYAKKRLYFSKRMGREMHVPSSPFDSQKYGKEEHRRSPLLSPKTKQWNGGTSEGASYSTFPIEIPPQKCNFTFYTSKVPQLPSNFQKT